LKPTTKETISGYELSWTDERIKISTNRIHIHKDGRITGELLITTSAKDFNPILHPPTQINFSADRTRKELANTLKEKYSQWDWSTIIDQLAYKIQELARAGEPIREIWTSEEGPSPEYLLEPF